MRTYLVPCSILRNSGRFASIVEFHEHREELAEGHGKCIDINLFSVEVARYVTFSG
jgi:hypothetical protein